MKLKILIILSLSLLSSSCKKQEFDIQYYHVSIEWHKNANRTDFYEITSYFYEQLYGEVELYSAIDYLNGFDIMISEDILYDEALLLIEGHNFADVTLGISKNLYREELNSKVKSIPSVKGCQVIEKGKFKSWEEGKPYFNELSFYMARRGHAVNFGINRNENYEYDLDFDFLYDCEHKEEIIKELDQLITSNALKNSYRTE